MKTPSVIEQDPRWAAVLARDPLADGQFVYAVKTTGIYCQPSSPTRIPKPQHVEFFETAAEAEAAGYRPSRRTAAEVLAQQQTALVAEACRRLDEAEEPLTLTELAHTSGLSPHHFHRVFKAVTGLTPKAYGDARRARKLRAQLSRQPTVTDAIYEAGFNSNSRVYENSNRLLGMTPGRFRDGGINTRIYFALAESSLGPVLVAQSDRGVCAILLGDDPYALLQELQAAFPKSDLVGADAAFEQVVAQVVGLIEEPSSTLTLPLDIRGTVFQQRVWQALQQIPVGSTATYTDIAKKIGSPKAVRAVAGACAANTLAVAIPCHRVIRRDGGLSGYRWGVERKQQLLSREKNNKASEQES